MANQIRIVFTTILILISAPLTAIAGPCDAYFGFDNNLTDNGGNGYDGEMIGANGAAAKANYTEGKFGQALELDGTGGMRALIDLHWDICPQVTISAWIKVSRDASNASPVLFSTGQGSGPGMYFTTNYLRLNGTDNGIYRPDVVRPGSWMFVAGVYNYDTGIYELYYGARSPVPGKLAEHRSEPENAFWIGTENDGWDSFAGGVAVDELRITGQALETPEVMALQALAPTTEAGINDGGSAVADSGQSACDSQSNCPTGYYCAVDNVCYPNSQLPKDYTASVPTGTTGRPGITLPPSHPADELAPSLGGDDTASGSGGSSSRPGITPPPSHPADELAPDLSAGQVMAGRWVYSEDVLPGISGGNLAVITLKFSGRDNGLSGTVSTLSAEISDEPLTNVSKIGRTVSLSSPNFGSWSGQVAENGGTMTLRRTDPDASSRFFVKVSNTVASEPPPPPAPSPDPEPDPADDQMNSHVRPGPTGARKYSAISGIVGNDEESVDLVNGFITEIQWGEVSDRPCELKVVGWRPSTVPAGYERAEKYERFGTGCSPSVGIGSSGLDHQIRLDRTLAGIGRIQVCNNINNNMRLKGVRIWGDAILDDGSTTYIPNGDALSLPNCQVWQSDVLCPDDTWATGVLVFTRDAGGFRKQITGLQLICRAIVAPGVVPN